MSTIIYFIIIALLSIGFITFVIISYLRADYDIHKSMVVWLCNLRNYGTIHADFDEFKRKFDSTDWYQYEDGMFPESLFVHGDGYFSKSEIHAFVILFDNVGMIMKSNKDFKKAMKYTKQYIINLRKGNK